MKTPFYIVNAFTQTTFGGNPAAVCPLDAWLSDEVMQRMAAQHNLSETAFFIPSDRADVDFSIRWFTPTNEVDLCGHATLASAHVIFSELSEVSSTLVLDSQSGLLHVTRDDDGKYHIDFPKNTYETLGVTATFSSVGGARPIEAFAGKNAQPDVVLVYEDAEHVIDMMPNLNAMKTLKEYRCVIATAKSESPDVDFVCRVFAPNYGIDEDPVTGSAYTLLAPIWADKLAKDDFFAQQTSARGGDVWCKLVKHATDERVIVSGFASRYAQGELYL